MCILDGLFGGERSTGTETEDKTGTTTPDALTQMIRQAMIPHTLGVANQSFPSYDWTKRVAPLTPMQTGAIHGIGKMGPALTKSYNAANKMVQGAGNAPAFEREVTPGRVTMHQADMPGRIVDAGKLGSIDEYMDPFLEQAMQPAIRKMTEQGERQRNDIGHSRQLGGAFGDARHGVAEAENYLDEREAIGDLTYRAKSDAYGTAMGQRASDLDRITGVDNNNTDRRIGVETGNVDRKMVADTDNANRGFQAYEAAQGRKLQAGAQTGAMGMDFNNALLSLAGAKLNAGGMQQGLNQGMLDARYEDFLRGVEWPFRQQDTWMSLLTGQPNAQTVTTSGTRSGTQPDSGIWGLLGSLAPALF